MNDREKMATEIRSLHNKLQEAYTVRDHLRDSLATATNEVAELREQVISLMKQLERANADS